MAAYAELMIEQYSDFSTTINIEDPQGDVMNLTGYTANSQIRKSYYSTTATSLNVTVTDISTGEITIRLDSANTAILDPGRQQFDLIISSPTGEKTRVIEGIVIVLPGVTHG